MRGAAPAALALLALALTGCETSAQKSAQLERAAKRQQRQTAAGASGAQRGLSISHVSTRIKVLSAAVLHSSEGDAVVLALRNSSATSLRNAAIAITVTDARGASVYTNDAPGLSATLTSVPLLRAHATTIWIDDQIDPTGTPAKVSAKIGEGTPLTAAAIPKLSVEAPRLSEGAVEGELVNHALDTQRELVVNGLARRGEKIVAAGRALVAQAAGGGARTHFQLYLIGDAASARLETSVSPNLSAPGGGA